MLTCYIVLSGHATLPSVCRSYNYKTGFPKFTDVAISPPTFSVAFPIAVVPPVCTFPLPLYAGHSPPPAIVVQPIYVFPLTFVVLPLCILPPSFVAPPTPIVSPVYTSRLLLYVRFSHPPQAFVIQRAYVLPLQVAISPPTFVVLSVCVPLPSFVVPPI